MSEDIAPDITRIYETYHGKVVAYAARLVGHDDAEDVAQEVFVKVDRSLAQLEDPSKLAPWIYAITLNTVRDLVRKRAARPERTGPAPATGASDGPRAAPGAPMAADSPRTPEEIAIRNEMIACYLDHLEQLPRLYYEVYVLSEFDHLSNQEIARRLSISLATAKMRLHRARTRLNQELRLSCRCYYNERGELEGEPRDS